MLEEAENIHLLDLDFSSDSESDYDDMDVHQALRNTNRVKESVDRGMSEPTVQQDRVLCAISESRASNMLGMAIINVTLGQVDLIRIVNNDRYQRMSNTLQRTSIVPPQTFLVLKNVVQKHSKSFLAQRLKEDFPDADVVALDREYWNESEGLRMIDRFAWRKHVKALRRDLEHNFYVSCAFSAVMAYVERAVGVMFRRNSLRVKYRQPENTMGLDRATFSSLELFQNIRNSKGANLTLFGLLDNTLTPQGRRMVRSALLQPSTDRNEIVARHEAVEELSSNENLFTAVRASLKKLLHIDIERSIPWIAKEVRGSRLPLQDGVALIHGHHQIIMPSHEELQRAENDLNSILMIKAYLGGVQEIQETLEMADCTSRLCKWVLEKCARENTAPLIGLIERTIERDATYSKAPIDVRNNRLWAVKAPPNGLLERARQLYRELTNELHQYVEEISKVFQEHLGTAPELQLGKDHRYYLKFQWSDVERELMSRQEREPSRPAGYHDSSSNLLGGVEIVNGVRHKQHYHCETMELLQMGSQIQRQADIVTAQSDKLVVELKRSLSAHGECLLGLSEATAVLDMLSSFAHLATTQNYVRPIMSDTLVLKDARHPMMEVRKPNFVANDVYSGDQAARFQVVTGGNMSGKSTFIRSIALIQIMAQVGSFVPATYAALPICDRVFSRLSTEDKPESNMSTFGVEMAEMNMILRQATKDSLVIIDELGRGTSTKEGLAIALAMSEHLIGMGCRVFFATHFTELAPVLNQTKQGSVLTVHVSGECTVAGNTPLISLPHKIAPGPVSKKDYGLALARRFLPERVIRNAERVSKFLRERHASKETGPATRAAKQNKLVFALPELLKQAVKSKMDDSSLGSYAKKLQTEFICTMHKAADDEGREEEAGQHESHAVERPILEKPSEEELDEWMKKCDAAERRVMHANMAHSQDKKRPVSRSQSSECSQKRNKTDGETDSVLSQPTPINRGSMIDRLRRGTRACTPTTRAATPSSFTMGATDVDAESITEESEDQQNRPTEQTASGQGNRAISISSGSSNDDEDMQDMDDDIYDEGDMASDGGSREDLSGEPRQPLESFQPLKKWYARKKGTESPSTEQ
ncbi:81145c05-24a5-493d-828d-d3f0b052c801 [Thermothielavioides terrestris]|uniref:DNA mismatch repair protein MSH3 n=1 Tax=Thermothielavioides terrestris TaxID=2587410 RepID=A0A446B7H4_9PEZI|nr:81145c05-24a5-493d-828d-d3f0b052c801 [Thermothielavioides terrestris]